MISSAESLPSGNLTAGIQRDGAPALNRKRFEKLIHLALTVREALEMNAHFVEQCQVKISEWRRPRVFDVTASLHSDCRTTCQKNGQVRVIVDIGVADAAPVKIERMIEQRPVAFGGGLQLCQEFREERHMELIDLCHSGDLFRVVAVMR